MPNNDPPNCWRHGCFSAMLSSLLLLKSNLTARNSRLTSSVLSQKKHVSTTITNGLEGFVLVRIQEIQPGSLANFFLISSPAKGPGRGEIGLTQVFFLLRFDEQQPSAIASQTKSFYISSAEWLTDLAAPSSGIKDAEKRSTVFTSWQKLLFDKWESHGYNLQDW